MSKGTIITLSSIGGLLLLLIAGYLSFSNDANGFEVDIPNQYQQTKNVYDNGWKQVMEQNQISTKYSEGFKNAYQAILKGDPNGQQAMLQVLTAMPNYDASIFKKVMDSIESFHSTFSATQSNLIAKKQAYNRLLVATNSGRFYNMFSGYPHIRCGIPDGSKDDYAILTSDKTETDFQKHKADALDLK
jgi:hypothetical protein